MTSVQLYGPTSPTKATIHYMGVVYVFIRDGVRVSVPDSLAQSLIPGSKMTGFYRL